MQSSNDRPRLLVVGSRSWKNPPAVGGAIINAIDELTDRGIPPFIWFGDQDQGAEAHAAHFLANVIGTDAMPTRTVYGKHATKPEHVDSFEEVPDLVLIFSSTSDDELESSRIDAVHTTAQQHGVTVIYYQEARYE